MNTILSYFIINVPESEKKYYTTNGLCIFYKDKEIYIKYDICNMSINFITQIKKNFNSNRIIRIISLRYLKAPFFLDIYFKQHKIVKEYNPNMIRIRFNKMAKYKRKDRIYCRYIMCSILNLSITYHNMYKYIYKFIADINDWKLKYEKSLKLIPNKYEYYFYCNLFHLL